MESFLDEEKQQLVVQLSHEDGEVVAAGGRLAQQGNPIDDRAELGVRPLGDIDPTYEPLPPADIMRRWSRMGSGVCRAGVLRDGTITVYVSQEAIIDALSQSMTYPNIDGREDLLPSGGIRIEFGTAE